MQHKVGFRDSIATHLVKVIFGLYVLVISVVTGFQMYFEYKYVEDTIESQIEDISKTFGPGIANSIWTFNDETLESILDGINNNPNVIGLKLNVGEKTITRGQFSEEETHELLKNKNTKNSRVHLENQNLIEYRFTITPPEGNNESDVLATIYFYTSPDVIFSHVKYGYVLIVIGAVVGTIALWIIFIYFIKRLLGTPITKLTDKISDLDFDNFHEVDIGLDKNNRNELVVLEEAYNEMLVKLGRSKEGMEAINQHLEEIVDARTAALETEIERKEYAQKIAEEASYAKSMFLANMSHEIRTPLNGILGIATLLEKSLLSEEQKKYIKTLNISGHNLLKIINDILDFSKIEAGKIELEQENIDVQLCVDTFIGSLMPIAEENNVDLAYELSPRVPKHILIDSTRFSQILINLVSNAIKFSKFGDVQIHIDFINNNDLDYLQVEVKDSGIGIPEDVVDTLFDAFNQADISTTRKYGGTGLGLAICKNLVELMGGEISVKSEIEVGSTFTFTLATQRTDKPIVENIAQSTNLKLNTKENLKILVVEDNLINQMITVDLLSHLGLKCDVAENGQQAVDAAKLSQYDLVFMDMQMPIMDGIEATKNILQNTPKSHRPIIIALTANVMKQDIDRCMNVGMKDFLTKPIELDKMVDKLNKWA